MRLCIILFLVFHLGAAQNTRISDHNNIGWYSGILNVELSNSYGFHAEYQWRRTEILDNWQQGLFRTSISYKASESCSVRLGYALAETEAYGEIPINGYGRDFTEHRIFEAVQISGKIGKFLTMQRFMLEQRWVGRFRSEGSPSEDDFPFTNRARYLLRLQLPLSAGSDGKANWYVAVYDEIMIGFGKNVNQNVFDQNRIGFLLGKSINSAFRVEGGYLNQILQLGRQVDGRDVFQYNNGIVLSGILNLDLKPEQPKDQSQTGG